MFWLIKLIHCDSRALLHTWSVCSGADPGFSEGGSENLKKDVWSVALEVIGICIVKQQNYTL